MKILSFNVWTKNSQIEKVAEIFKTENPDLLFLQEITVEQYRQLDRLLEGIKTKHQLHVSQLEDNNLVIISRMPIMNHENISRLPTIRDNIINERIKIQKATLQHKGRNILVYNVHFLRKFWSNRIKEITDFCEHELTNKITPIILAGDFNATPFDKTYRTISLQLHNAHEMAGHGFGFTYPTPDLAKNWPFPLKALARIDHIFLSDHFTIKSAETLTLSGGSDHYPVKTDVVLKLD